jgi:delta1-piperideine-2-carboxylate reductase
MTVQSDTRRTHFEYRQLVDIVRPVFVRHGCSPDVARLLAENCVSAERDGALSHGLFRLPGYVSSLRAGWVDGRASAVVEDVAPAFLRIDGGNGFTVPALAAGKALASERARRNGVAIVAIRNSHHLGALSLDVEPFAAEGLIALSFINSMKAVVPFGGNSAVFGTNPMAFAAPRTGTFPVVVDQATSSMAHGDVQIAAQEGRELPPNSAVDRNGNSTTDPQVVLNGGALLPFGGYKGSSIAMMVEILCAALVGGKFSHEVDLSAVPGAATPHTGQCLILIDPETGRGTMPSFVSRLEALIQAMRSAGQERLPGDRRLAARIRAERAGIPVTESTLQLLREFGGAAVTL